MVLNEKFADHLLTNGSKKYHDIVLFDQYKPGISIIIKTLR